MLFIVSLFVFVGSVFAAIAIFAYIIAAISCVNDQVKKTKIEATKSKYGFETTKYHEEVK